MKKITSIAGAVGTKLCDRSRSVKFRLLEIGRIARTKAKGAINRDKLKRYNQLLNATSRVVGQAKRFSAEIVEGVKQATADSRQILPRGELINGVLGCDILFSLLHDRIDREVIAANPKLRAIASMSITPDNIDVATATARRIPVTVVPVLAVESTADTHFALLLAVARRVMQGDQLVRSGIFPGSQANYLVGSGVHGKTIGLVGGRGPMGFPCVFSIAGQPAPCLRLP